MHPLAMPAAMAAMAAHEQGKFWEYHDKLFANQPRFQPDQLLQYAREVGLDVDRFKAALDGGRGRPSINADMAEANSLGVTGTPAFAGVLPCPGPEGSSAPWLGALAGLVERLGTWRERLAGRYPAGRWAALLRELVDDFLVPTDDEEEARLLELGEAALGVADAALGAGYTGAFGREVFRERLIDALAGHRGAPPVLAGGVIFAGLGQLPGVPARVVWLLGMNGADYGSTSASSAQ